MPGQISLRETERKAFRAFFNDGLVDIFLGSWVLMFAIGPFLSPFLGDFWSTAVFLPFWGLVILAIWFVRKHLVTPRVGIVKFGLARKRKLRKFILVMLVVNLSAFLLGLLLGLNAGVVPGHVLTAVFGLIVLNLFSIAAYFLDISRLYLYGIMFALSFVVGELLYRYLKVPHHGYPVAFGFTSAVMFLGGLRMLIRLLRNNPVPATASTS
jgi:MFS family permease